MQNEGEQIAKPTMLNQQNSRGNLLFFLAALLSLFAQTTAFSVLSPTRLSLSRQTQSWEETKVSPATCVTRNQRELHLFGGGQDPQNDDWLEKALKLVGQGGSKLKELAGKTANLIKSSWLASRDEDAAVSGLHIDTQDEELFRSIMNKAPSRDVASVSVDRLVDQAALILQRNEDASAMLGDSIQHGNPFPQSSSATTIAATFEVWGLKGQGTATLTAVDDDLTSLELCVGGGNTYQIPLSSGIPSKPQTSNTKSQQVWEPKHIDNVLEVEVVEGVRRLNPPKGSGVIDADILEKRVFM